MVGDVAIDYIDYIDPELSPVEGDIDMQCTRLPLASIAGDGRLFVFVRHGGEPTFAAVHGALD